MKNGCREHRTRAGMLFIAVILGLLSLSSSGAVETGRVKEIAAMLPEEPVGIARPISDRTAWEALSRGSSVESILAHAERLAGKPIQDQPDSLYLDFSETGNRTRWQEVASRRRNRLMTFAVAECIENKGRFLKPLENSIRAICAEKTWLMPAHDRSLANFKGASIDIDLASSALAWHMATVDRMLGDKLDPVTRQLIRKNVRARVLDPFMAMVDGTRKRNWWMDATMNWNSVCLAGTVGTALAMVESPEERARFILAAQKYSESFLIGFGKDGYCSEGLGYWNYGFGNYVMMAETVLKATGGKIDLLDRDDARLAARFGARIEIMNGVYPAFADCAVGSKPDPRILSYASRKYGLDFGGALDSNTLNRHDLFGNLFFSLADSGSGKKSTVREPGSREERTWFESAGALICRPGGAWSCKMAVALKGGNNNEHHNHNDVGTFVVVVGKTPVLLDPGPEVYTSRTFSSRRYDSKLLNSYGHPVPVVSGKLQQTGAKARGEVLKAEFTDLADTLALDIRSAYDVKELKKLTRTFVYSRVGNGSLTIIDEVEFINPSAFGTALITLGVCKVKKPGQLMVSYAGEAVSVDVKVEGSGFAISTDEIKEDVRTEKLPTRIGINLTKPVSVSKVTMNITPVVDSTCSQ